MLCVSRPELFRYVVVCKALQINFFSAFPNGAFCVIYIPAHGEM